MKVTTFGKIGVALGAAALICSAVAVPAQADPTISTYPTLAGFGSDTTQDVMNGIAAAIGGDKLASYDATGSLTVKSRNGGVDVPRASGSGAGLNLLQVATGKLATASIARFTPIGQPTVPSVSVGPEVIGQVDFARSSSSPAANVAGGVFTNIPFARDAVGVAYSNPLLSQVPFIVGTATDTTTPSLYNIYRGDVKYLYFDGATYVSAGKTATPLPGSATVAYKIQPILPASGSGTRSYFLGQLGFSGTNADKSSWVSDTVNLPAEVLDTYNGAGIQENRGAAIVGLTTGNTVAVSPFSIGQWVAQGNDIAGVTDGRDGVKLADLAKLPADTRKPAVTGTEATAWATNTEYAAMVRDVFNIVPSRLADDSTSAINKMFVGPSSLVCLQSATITKYGFLPLTGTDPNSTTTCGYAGYDNDGGTAVSTSTSVLNVAASVVTGSPLALSATITSIHNGGGTVNFKNGSTVIGTATVPFGSTTSSSVSYTPTAAGSLTLTAQFIPSLPAVASSTSLAKAVSVTAPVVTPPVVTPTATTTVVTAPALTIGKSATVSVAVTGNTVGGTVAVSDGATVVGTAALAAGSRTATVTFVPKKTSYSFSATFTPSTAAVTASTSAAVAATAAKGTASVKVSKIASIKVGKKAKVTVTVSSTAGTPAGTVTVKEGKKTLASKIKLKSGKAVISISKLKKGSHKLVVTYNGSTTLNTAKKTATSFKVK